MKTKPMTTTQQLGSIIKSARQIMRKDKGLSGELDRLPVLTWVMFLKFLDDLEQLRETEALLQGRPFQLALEAPYRWRDWAAVEGGITGDELIGFIGQQVAILPNGKLGDGLFTYLRKLQGANGGDRRDVIAIVFKGLQNRMINGYLLRDVIDKINRIHFNSSEEMHTLSRLYETMLREMRDAAGDSGEFYTPRPVVQFMVEVIDPRLGESILDPACGTGGFLVEAMTHLEKQCRSVEERAVLQNSSLYGGEAKPLPYLLAQMNLLLHGLEYPRIDPENSLRFPLREIGDKDRVDVILTNPPFGGEEEKGILGNFPEDMQTAETALLFLQLIMRKLKRPGGGNESGGRAAVVVPNGTLFADGVAARIKEELLKNFNLHTIVRLPEGVFAPYTDIPANLIFFDRSGPTQDIWYYQIALPEGRRKYTKTKPMDYAEFADCLNWWNQREATANAWKATAADVLKYDAYGKLLSANLDIKNPNSLETLEHRPLDELTVLTLKKKRHVISMIEELEKSLADGALHKILEGAQYRPMSEIAPIVRRPVEIDLDDEYPELGVRSFGRGTFHKAALKGIEVGTKKLYYIHPGDLVLSNVFAWEGAIAVVQPEDTGRVGSHRFITCLVKKGVITPEFLRFYLLSDEGIQKIREASPGGAGRNRTLGLTKLEQIKVPVPAYEKQVWFDQLQAKVAAIQKAQADSQVELEALLPAVLDRAFKGAL